MYVSKHLQFVVGIPPCGRQLPGLEEGVGIMVHNCYSHRVAACGGDPLCKT